MQAQAEGALKREAAAVAQLERAQQRMAPPALPAEEGGGGFFGQLERVQLELGELHEEGGGGGAAENAAPQQSPARLARAAGGGKVAHRASSFGRAIRKRSSSFGRASQRSSPRRPYAGGARK